MRVIRALPSSAECARRGAGIVAACVAFGLLAGVATAREPWPDRFASAPDLPFEPLPMPDAGPMMMPPAQKYTVPAPSYAEPVPTPAAAPQAARPSLASTPAAADASVLMQNQEPIPAGACGPLDDGCPGYRLYAVADALFLARYAALEDRPLVLDSETRATLVSSQALQWAFAPGVRAFFGERKPNGCGWEVGYLGIYNSTSSKQIFGPENLNAPPDLDSLVHQFSDAELMQLTYVSTLNMAEANVFWYDCCGTGQAAGQCQTDACAKPCGSCRCIDWLAGFRYAGLSESAGFTSTCCNLTQTSTYNVNANTNLFGGQIGVRGRRDYQQWAMEGWLKVGLAGTWLSQSQAPVFAAFDPEPRRPASSASATGLGGFADANASLIYRINRHWGVRAGFNVIWLGNVALAADQWDFQALAANSVSNGSLFLLGGNLGVEARW